VSDFFRYAISPGTAFAVQVVRVEPSHRGLGVFLDVFNWYARVMWVAFVVNATLYGLLMFGIITGISVVAEKRRADSQTGL
jgi:hypothetical protein